MDPAYKKAYLLYHVCVFLWGFTAVFGKVIDLTETMLVWYRMGITTLVLLFLPAVWKHLHALNRKTIFQLFGIGILVAMHWIAFYGSIKAANISVALTTLATTSIFVSIGEPLLFKRKFIWHELALGILVVPAMYLIFTFSGEYTKGIILGLISTVFATAFSLLNKKMIAKAHPLHITGIEIGSGFLVLTCVLPFYIHAHPDIALSPSGMDTIYLLIFAVVCTVLPFTLSLYSLRHISVFTASITLNLEPVYGIAMAIFFFHENKSLHPGFYVGTLIILAIVFLDPFIRRKFGQMRIPPYVPGE
ncbi:MAG: DMT family transporter [Chitinophagales bacterium]